MNLRIACGQFPVSADMELNAKTICRQVGLASRRGAKLILFCETALSGYAGYDFDSFENFDWSLLQRMTELVKQAAQKHQLWTVVGTTHRRKSGRPFNSLLVIDDQGEISTRYDKRMCTVEEQQFYSAGSQPGTFQVAGVRCGTMICHEWRYPELYREYKRLGTEVLLQSWYDGALSATAMREFGDRYAKVIPAAVQGHAVCNHMWICGANTARRHSCFGAIAVQPDGLFAMRRPPHTTGVSVVEIDDLSNYSDTAAHLRPKVMRRYGPAG